MEEKKILSVPQQIMVGTLGKIVRDFFNEEYLKCNCPVCTKMKKLHKESEVYVSMVTRMAEHADKEH